MKKIVCILFFISINTLTACNKTENTHSESTSETKQNKLTITSENLEEHISANLNLNKNPVTKLVPTELRLELKSKNEGLRNADILIDLTMPGMTMPKNEIKLKESLPGIYNGQTMFTMSGDWRLNTTVTSNGKSIKMYFDVKVQ